MPRTILQVALAASICLLALSAPTKAAEMTAQETQLYEAAKKEGL